MALDPSGTPSMAAINQAIADGAAQAVLDALPARDTVTVEVSGTAQGFLDVDFPAGKFTERPIVSVSGTGGTNARFYIVRADGVTADGMTIIASHRDGTVATNSIVCDWFAYPANGDE